MTDFASSITLGATGLTTGQLILSSSYGVGAEGVQAAFDRGQNLFHFGMKKPAGFTRVVARLAAADRSSVSIALHSYSRSALLLRRSVESQLRALNVDRIDVLILGYWQGIPWPRIVAATRRLKAEGKVKILGVACHNRPLFRTHLEQKIFDLFMIRYNAAHRGAEVDLFDRLPETGGPAILAYTATRWGHLLDSAKMPPGESPLSASDCYRFALSHPRVHAVLCGPSGLAQTREALATLDAGPLTPEETERIHRIGDFVHTKKKAMFY